MKTYIKDCMSCGAVFEAKHANTKLCSEECKTAHNRKRWKKYDEQNREDRATKALERFHNETPEKREQRNANKRALRSPANEASRAEAKALRATLDGLEFNPDNLPRIALMIDYIEADERLAFLLDWYWLSDAKEYLDEYH